MFWCTCKKMNKFNKRFLFFSLISLFKITIGSTNIIYKSFVDSSYLSPILVNILKSCNAKLHTAIIDDEFNTTIDHFVQRLSPISIIALNRNSKKSCKSLDVINGFVATTNSIKQLRDKLRSLKDSRWWNINIPIFILDSSNKFCNNSLTTFEILWDYNLINSYYFCSNDRGKVMIYTYNPYSNRMSNFWNLTSKSTKYHSLNVFNRPYNEENICNGLDFDRTKTLDGAVITIALTKRQMTGETINSKIFHGVFRYYGQIATSIIYTLNNTFRHAFNLKGKSTHDLHQFLRNGSFDLAFVDKYKPMYSDVSITYPVWYFQYYIIAPKKEAFTPLEKIWNFYGVSILMFTLSIIIITFIFLLFVMKKKMSFATFEILRLVTNTSLHTEINRLPARLFFSTIFIYFLIIQSTFQGHLSQFLTKYESRPSITSLDDLRDPKYEFISAPRELKSMMDPVLTKKMYYEHNKACIDEVKVNKSLVCIRPYGFINDDIPYFRHLHKIHLFQTLNYYTFVTRDDWPLKNRIDTVMMRLEQSNLVQKWRDQLDRIIFYIERCIWGFRRYEPMKNIKPIPLNSLKFAFQFWLMGMLCSIVCFMYELSNKKKQKNVKLLKNKKKEFRYLISKIKKR